MNRIQVISPIAASILVAALAQNAAAQFIPVTQERSALTSVSVSSGASNGDSAEATDFGLFSPSLTSTITGAAGASATANAAQTSSFSPTLIFGDLSASSAVATGATFVTAESDGASNLLFIFDLAAPTEIAFTASGSMSFVGTNPDGEPSDLYGAARVRLLDADTMDQVAGFQLFGPDAATDSAFFSGTLPAGSYAILAFASTHAFSADLLGPPARSGSGEASVSFSFALIPAPSAAALLGLGTLALARRRCAR